jgi:ketosteroid isomerase-like protein
MKRSLLVLAVTLPAACSPPRSAEDDRFALSAQLDSIEALFAPGEAIDDVFARYVSFFAEDAVLLPPEADPVVGRERILAFYVAAFEGLEPISLEYGSPQVIVDGDLAVRRYQGAAVAIIGPDTLNFATRYVDALQRSPEGWRILWHTWSSIN